MIISVLIEKPENCNMLKVLVWFLFAAVVAGQTIDDEFKNHPCNRTCDGNSRTCEYHLTIQRVYTMEDNCSPDCLKSTKDCPKCIKADGHPRPVMAFNRIMPGPSIRVCQGDTIIAKVTNNMVDTVTSIHWHGMRQINTANMDGATMVTEYGMRPEHSYVYQFRAADSGTHFYHTHSMPQKCDGAFGALIVSKMNTQTLSVYDLPEHTILINDWNSEPAESRLVREDRMKDIDVEVTSILINGVGKNLTNKIIPKTFTVMRDRRYRFRVIHAGCRGCSMELGIADHKLTIVAVDGNEVTPFIVDTFTLMNGERLDFILETNKKIDNYIIRIDSSAQCNRKFTYAVLQYQSAKNLYSYPNEPARFALNRVQNCDIRQTGYNCYNYNNMTSISLTANPRLYKVPDFKYYIGVDLKYFARSRARGVREGESLAGMINNIFMIMPTTPMLQNHNQSTCYYENCISEFCECPHQIDINSNDIVELIMVNEGRELNIDHSFHLHGYKFIVVAQGKIGDSVPTGVVRGMDLSGAIVRNFNNPVIKDTVVVPDGGYAVIRFMANNPGFWMLRCMNDFNADSGMEMIIRTGMPTTYDVFN